MQSRRHDDMMTQSPVAKLRNHRFELGHDQYLISSGEEQSIRSRRSLSPSRLDGSQRIVSGDRRRTSIERRDHDWPLGGGRSDRLRSRSPPYEQVRKRPQFDEGLMHTNRSSPPLELRRRYELSEDFKPDANTFPSLKRYGHSSSRTSKDKDLNGSRLSASDGHGVLVQKSMAMDDGAVRGLFRLPQELGTTSNYKETGGDLSSLPGNFGIGRFEDERIRHRNPSSADKLLVVESYREGEKHMFYSRDVSYPAVPASQFKDFASTSSGISRGDVPASYRDPQPLPADELPRNSGKPSELLGFHGYGPSPLLDSTRAPDAGPRDLTCYRWDAHSPGRIERRDYLYQGEDFGYPSDDIYKKIHPHARVDYDHGDMPSHVQVDYDRIDMPTHARLDYGHGDMPTHAGVDYDRRDLPPYARVDYGHGDMPTNAGVDYDRRDLPPHARVDYDHRDLPPHARVDYDQGDMPPHERVNHCHKDSLRPSIIDLYADSIDNAEDSRGNLRKSSLWVHSPLQEQKVSNYPDISRTLYTSKQRGEYVGSGKTNVEFGRKMLRDCEISNLSVSGDHGMSHLRANYGFGRDAGPGSHKEGLKGSSVSEYDAARHRLAVRRQRLEAEELGIYDSSGRILKRKYSVDEETRRYNSSRIIPSKWNMPSGTQDVNDGVEEWNDEDMSGLYSSRTVHYDHQVHHRYRKSGRMFDGRDHPKDFSYGDLSSSQEPYERLQGRLSESYKPARRYIKGHPVPGSLSWYNSYHLNRKGDFQKQHKVWKRSTNDHYVDVHADDVDPSEDWMIPAKSELPEDAEEFKQLVHRAFLKFSKKLNENPAVRRRYKEQGKAGSLFCIVCGRSLSKEFMDTQRLVTHAFMSHKIGLRAQHLGLHKAICVLLGWNSIVAPDTITWVPEILPDAEALAQKEDLMLWPPLIIIHNSSISKDNPEERKVLTIEELGSFLRGKGFGGGKFKVCLGKHANQSIMVVKFLGTFPGLQDAERLHKYFAENKRGRADFEQITSNNDKSNNSEEAGMEGNKVEELTLCGYMGIAEDLEKLDFDIRRRCLIKSKKEIQDLANDPVKPDER